MSKNPNLTARLLPVCALAIMAAYQSVANAQPRMPERFALLEQKQIAFMCSYALMADAVGALEAESSAKTIDNAVRYMTASRVWNREAHNVDAASAKRWRVTFDGQSRADREAQMDYCYGSGIGKLQSMAEAEANVIVDGARTTVRKLVEVRGRFGR